MEYIIYKIKLKHHVSFGEWHLIWQSVLARY